MSKQGDSIQRAQQKHRADRKNARAIPPGYKGTPCKYCLRTDGTHTLFCPLEKAKYVREKYRKKKQEEEKDKEDE